MEIPFFCHYDSFFWLHKVGSSALGPKKINCYVALSRPTVKCEKTGSGFFFFFFLCQIWAKNLLKFVFNGLKKHLHDLYMRFDCIPPEFSPFRNFKKKIGKLNSLTVRKKKKKKKKSRPTDPIFKFWSGEGNITIFFFWPYYSFYCHPFVLSQFVLLPQGEWEGATDPGATDHAQTQRHRDQTAVNHSTRWAVWHYYISGGFRGGRNKALPPPKKK